MAKECEVGGKKRKNNTFQRSKKTQDPHVSLPNDKVKGKENMIDQDGFQLVQKKIRRARQNIFGGQELT